MPKARRVAMTVVLLSFAALPLLATDNPLPSITQVDPAYMVAGGAAFSLTITGTGFVPASVVQWNGADRTTTYMSDTQLVAAINAADIAVASAVVVTVTSPAPGGGTSNQAAVNVAPLRSCVTVPITGCTFSEPHDLTSTGCDSIHRPGAYAVLFSFQGAAGASVVVDMSCLFDSYLYLLRPDGSVAAENDEGPVQGSYIATTLDVTGKWTVEATSYHPAATGAFTLSVSSCDAAASPANVVVTYDHDVSSPGVNVTWLAVAGAVDYEADVNGYLLNLGTTGTAAKISGLAEPVCYAIRIRAVYASTLRSSWSPRDLAVSTVYADDPLTGQTVPVRASDFSDLRSAIALVRQAAGIGAASYSANVMSGTRIMASDLTDTQDALNGALTALGMTPVSFIGPLTDPKIDASRLQMLRDATK